MCSALLFFSLMLGVAFSANMTKFVVQPVLYGSACLDGSPPAYYFTPGTGTGKDFWYIHHQGGGWCTSLASCLARSRGPLGSTKNLPAAQALPGGYFSNDVKVNPLMANWNKVFLVYCDGGSFSGDNDTVTMYQGKQLHFRGYRNLGNIFLDLLVRHNLGPAREVVVSGCSAGGLATYLHLDWWAKSMPKNARVRGLPDSGFFLDYNSTHSPKYGRDMRWVFKQMNATIGVDQDCIEANSDDPAKCMFAEHTIPHIKTPFFPLQSIYDSWQTDNILGSKDAGEINKFGQDLQKRLLTSVFANPQNGGFIDSCHHHCGAWNKIVINDFTSSVAFQNWFNNGNGTFIQSKSYPCDACCTGGGK